MASERVLLSGEPPVEVLLKPSTRSRRLSLRVSRLDGRVTLSMPVGIPRAEAEGFLVEKSSWIREHLAGVPGEARPMPGTTLLFEGTPHRIEAAPQRGVSVRDGTILVPQTRVETTPARLAAFLKTVARDRLVMASEHYAAQIGRELGRVTLRDTRSRWGSCTHEGDLMYSWRLVMAPPPVLDYVAAHEVAHMIHMDHSARFWGLVGDICPDHKAQRQWLRQRGGELHRYRFRD
ncbi:M48 family metallopeptidase [Maritimibacter sp. DP1N21-5]|uniref:M48 family metallopeptidase n=1 Tax=Maritimibacter sp. DP1N21-5 TaxID=2836867 RepID=UPI001C458BA4|nr:SprT family zinc-dependent metalloprotease [Maritimibacter sp. DP1N21-5]MBV7408408.1 M48 family metallopeptidase [Maritimibacter sp. DP1N21-5]